jgi:hypothetical protein
MLFNPFLAQRLAEERIKEMLRWAEQERVMRQVSSVKLCLSSVSSASSSGSSFDGAQTGDPHEALAASHSGARSGRP